VSLDLSRDTLVITLAGSQAHGTAHAESDVDLRGVCVAPLSVRVSLFQPFEQFDGPLEGALGEQVRARIQAHPTAHRGLAIKTESVVFDIAKFLHLSASANPNTLEILFADERDWLVETPTWRAIHRERHRFLTRRVQQTYLGYGMAQLKKIQSHRAWLLSPPANKPTRAAFGLPETGTLSRDDQHRIETAIQEKIASYRLDDVEMPKDARIAMQERMEAFWMDTQRTDDAPAEEALREVAVGALRLPEEVALALTRERKYRAALKHWESYAKWKEERNPKRAHLETIYGYDTKHAMHLVRLMKTGLELLQTGELRVRREDAEELIAIREGALSYEALLARAKELEAAMHLAAQESRLPAHVDATWVDALAYSIIVAAR
jgi:predicted nucleotidyltransferase